MRCRKHLRLPRWLLLPSLGSGTVFHKDMSIRLTIAIAAVATLLLGCDGRTSPGAPGHALVRTFGSSASPDGSKRLEVTRRGKSLVDFKVVESSSGKQLVSDYIGSDAMRWFLHWETPTRLWGYGSDIGYFKVFDFSAGGSVTSKVVDDTVPIPRTVWENLPSSLQREFRVQQGGAQSR